MANFVDNQPRNYAPYVGLPVDTYAAVGMYKQQQYDQGVQQVQNYISSVGGLEVARDVDKQYLQAKVGEITTRINGLAGGDWSNKSLVSKATGIASSVAKDPNIENALYSTANIKSLTTSQKELKEKHPELYPVSAEWYDNKALMSYMSNPEVGVKYSGPKEATRHFGKERDENIRKALKDLSPTIVTTVKPNGSYEYVYDKSTMITPAQIQNVVDGVISSNPEYAKSLMLDGAYSYKDATPVELARGLPMMAKTASDQLNRYIKDFDTYYAANPNMSTGQRTKLLTEKATTIKNHQDTVDQLSKIAKNLQNADPTTMDMMKQELYRNNIMQGYVANFRRQEVDVEIKENINAVKSENFALDWIKAGLDPETKQPPLPGSKYYQYALNLKKKGKGDGTEGESLETFPMSGPANAKNTLSDLDATIQTLNKDLEESNNSFITAYMAKADCTREQAAAYVQQQEENRRNGENIDPDYLAFSREKENKNVLATAYGKVKVEAEQAAQAAAPISKLGYKQPQGLTFAVNYNEGTFLAGLDAFNKDVTEQAYKAGFGTKEGSRFGASSDSKMTPSVKDRFSKEVLKKYEGTQFYKFYKEIVDKGYTEFYSKITDPVKAQVEAQAEVRNKFIKDKTQSITATAKTLTEKSDEQKAANALVVSALQTQGVAEEEVSIPANIESSSIFTDPATGEIKINYTAGKEGDKVVKTVTLPKGSNVSFLPAPSQYEYIKNAIVLSSDKKTAPMTTSNGKITYKIGQNNYPGNSDYYVQIQIDGKWVTVPKLNRSEIGDVYEAISYTSSLPVLEGLKPKDASNKILEVIEKKLNEQGSDQLNKNN